MPASAAAAAPSVVTATVADQALYLGNAHGAPQWMPLASATRHGLIAGATGTGKTLSLQGLAEAFSHAGSSVFIADVKGDLSGICAAGGTNPKAQARAAELGFSAAPSACPTVFWDVAGTRGHPIRATVSDMGPLLFSRLLQLNDVQEGVLNVAFAFADDAQLLLLDLADLRALLNHMSANISTISAQYGAITPQSINAITRALLVLEQQGGDVFFGEPALDLNDFLRPAANGQGTVHVLAADQLMQTPTLYATLLLWLLSELFETLPEAGDLAQPKLVFFFDEAHLLFTDAPKVLLEKVTQLVRLIRSKGVGVYFITQNPADIPDDVLGQLGNRIQHGLRAFTPKDQKAVRAAAETFRTNPAFDTKEAITALGVGEALVSVLDATGTPTVVERVRMRPPVSAIGPATAAQRQQCINASPVAGKYDTPLNRESAYEMLAQKAAPKAVAASRAATPQQTAAPLTDMLGGEAAQFLGGVLRSAVRQEATKMARGLLRNLLK